MFMQKRFFLIIEYSPLSLYFLLQSVLKSVEGECAQLTVSAAILSVWAAAHFRATTLHAPHVCITTTTADVWLTALQAHTDSRAGVASVLIFALKCTFQTLTSSSSTGENVCLTVHLGTRDPHLTGKLKLTLQCSFSQFVTL